MPADATFTVALVCAPAERPNRRAINEKNDKARLIRSSLAALRCGMLHGASMPRTKQVDSLLFTALLRRSNFRLRMRIRCESQKQPSQEEPMRRSLIIPMIAGAVMT